MPIEMSLREYTSGTSFFLFFRSFVCRNGLTYGVSAVTTGACVAGIRNKPSAFHSAFIANYASPDPVVLT